VYALHIAKDFMEANGLQRGLLFTSDPYSDIVDPNDKNTDLIFGDAATVTLLSNNPKFEIGKGAFVTDGSAYEKLIKRKDEYLYMDGRGIFNFVMRNTPDVVESCLQKNNTFKEDVDIFIFHQASKYVIENLTRRMKIAEDKVPFTIADYGNTVSSSIPIILEGYLRSTSEQNIIICGFGVGLSLAASLVRRV
jgi:3-oxoacyl-[acyl-carrier-protein] synthase-3